ncbi:hypothetical protein RMATCC62417_00161 [Rhizopus microsporus]|nr:hypothetical protein RMATCC62417_00161 [Rhizopus microsporus]
MIVHSLVDVDVPSNSYTVAQSEWADGTRSDMGYASTESLPPILIEFQYQVNQDFMLRLINYSSNVYKRYKLFPIVLVIVTKSFSSAKFQSEFTISSKGSLLEASCKFWAKQCFLLTADAVSNNFHCETLDPMKILGYFLTHHALHQIPRHHWQNPTLMLLSSTAKDIVSKEGNDMIYKSNTRYIVNQAKGTLGKIIEENDNHETNSQKKKIRNYAKEGLLSIEQLEKDLGDNEQSDTTNKYAIEDIKFIEILSEPEKERNIRQRQSKRSFKSYKSSDTLRSSYYHIKRRKIQNYI